MTLINADKPQLWKQDIQQSVDQFNKWFILFAPKTFRESRIVTTEKVKKAFEYLGDLKNITPEHILKYPTIVTILRMSTAPPIAKDRLIGLAQVNKSLVESLEKDKLPRIMTKEVLNEQLSRICNIFEELLDRDIFSWLTESQTPTEEALYRASTIIADRYTGAVADPLIRNAQEQRQLLLIGDYLKARGYVEKKLLPNTQILDMEPGTYTFRLNIPVGIAQKINIPIDVVIQPKNRPKSMPILIEAKSAGDFTNVNKRRKEEATKIHQLKTKYGENTQLILFLCGYFDSGYLGYEAAEGLDWIWEHRSEDLDKLGI